ncbi:MAG: hypothetical protein IJ593_06950 [Lachnospiraceae bacterium]|nr:hypothetical protein [Lachnospiraceae bacterium]
MAKAKAKEIRLIDILGTIAENEYVVITVNCRDSYHYTAGVAEVELEKYLTAIVRGVTADGVIHIFI